MKYFIYFVGMFSVLFCLANCATKSSLSEKNNGVFLKYENTELLITMADIENAPLPQKIEFYADRNLIYKLCHGVSSIACYGKIGEEIISWVATKNIATKIIAHEIGHHYSIYLIKNKFNLDTYELNRENEEKRARKIAKFIIDNNPNFLEKFLPPDEFFTFFNKEDYYVVNL
jgi:hypothetical protein